MKIEDFYYYPLLKTTDAELKAYSNLDASVAEEIIPIFELTKSRRSKKNPIGKISNRLEQLVELSDGRPFILDLTTEPTLSNSETKHLLNSSNNGFAEWRNFVAEIENVIPVIHYNEDASDTDIVKQAKELEANHKYVAFRADAFDPDMMSYFKKILDALKRPERLITILDVGYVPVPSWNEAVAPIKARIFEILKYKKLNHIICLGSTFPKTVVATGYGQDDMGEFPISEIQIHEEVRKIYKDVLYGDYASIHPIRYQIGGGGWIPRIDVPLDKTCFYHRKRALKNKVKEAYVEVAETVVADKKYKPFKGIAVWGDLEIAAAASGKPNGKSPSHWIAVRANLHITKQHNRTEIESLF